MAQMVAEGWLSEAAAHLIQVEGEFDGVPARRWNTNRGCYEVWCPSERTWYSTDWWEQRARAWVGAIETAILPPGGGPGHHLATPRLGPTSGPIAGAVPQEMGRAAPPTRPITDGPVWPAACDSGFGAAPAPSPLLPRRPRPGDGGRWNR
ncbi:MAG TPA: hypothetical protein VF832_10450 [Longimicrobiales bacterium]